MAKLRKALLYLRFYSYEMSDFKVTSPSLTSELGHRALLDMAHGVKNPSQAQNLGSGSAVADVGRGLLVCSCSLVSVNSNHTTPSKVWPVARERHGGVSPLLSPCSWGALQEGAGSLRDPASLPGGSCSHGGSSRAGRTGRLSHTSVPWASAEAAAAERLAIRLSR